jgi:hypothetical protein
MQATLPAATQGSAGTREPAAAQKISMHFVNVAPRAQTAGNSYSFVIATSSFEALFCVRYCACASGPQRSGFLIPSRPDFPVPAARSNHDGIPP